MFMALLLTLLAWRNTLAHDLGVEAANFADFWREKQLEHSFRRGLMQNYADFSNCTSEALNFTHETESNLA
jgi:hypothetical protein